MDYNDLIDINGLIFTQEQYRYLRNYIPPINLKPATKEEIEQLFNLDFSYDLSEYFKS